MYIRYALRLPSQDVSSDLQDLGSLTVTDTVNRSGKEEVVDEEAVQFAMAYLPTSMANLMVRPPMLGADSCSLLSQLLNFYHGGDWPQCQAPSRRFGRLTQEGSGGNICVARHQLRFT